MGVGEPGADTTLWSERHCPETLDAMAGNGERLREARAWALEWQRGNTQKPLLVFGRPGTGKTLLAHVLASEMNWDLFELNASDFRTKEIIDRVAGAAAQSASFSGRRRLVLIDEVDGLSGREDKGGVAALSALLKSAMQPVVLTANDAYDRKLSSLRGVCQKLEFKRPVYTQVVRFLSTVCEKEGIDYDQHALTALAQNAQGDLRSALLDLQSICGATRKIAACDVEALGYRERQQRIFEVLAQIFHAKTVAEARAARDASDTGYDLLLLWMEENIPRHFNRDVHDRAQAMHYLSRADVFSGRILRRQHYGFLKYVNELATSGVAISRTHHYPGFISYQFPKILSGLSGTRDARASRKELAQHIQERVHGSAAKIIAKDLPYLGQAFANPRTAAALSAALELDAEQIAFLAQKKSTTKHVQGIFESAQKLCGQALLEKRMAFVSPPMPFAQEGASPKKGAPEEGEKEKGRSQTTLFGF